MKVCSLASGSSGNAILVEEGDSSILVDIGIGPHVLARALNSAGSSVDRLSAVLVTHEHFDHVRGLTALLKRRSVTVAGTRATLEAVSQTTLLRETLEVNQGCEHTIGRLRVRPFSVLHDAADPVGFRIESPGAIVTIATDCGSPTVELCEAMRGAHLCVLEANHDVARLWRGPYASWMKARIAGSHGHLSNADAATILAARLNEGTYADIWLAHLSAVNNSPVLARAHVANALQAFGYVGFTIDIAMRDRPSSKWSSHGRSYAPTLF